MNWKETPIGRTGAHQYLLEVDGKDRFLLVPGQRGGRVISWMVVPASMDVGAPPPRKYLTLEEAKQAVEMYLAEQELKR